MGALMYNCARNARKNCAYHPHAPPPALWGGGGVLVFPLGTDGISDGSRNLRPCIRTKPSQHCNIGPTLFQFIFLLAQYWKPISVKYYLLMGPTLAHHWARANIGSWLAHKWAKGKNTTDLHCTDIGPRKIDGNIYYLFKYLKKNIS